MTSSRLPTRAWATETKLSRLRSAPSRRFSVRTCAQPFGNTLSVNRYPEAIREFGYMRVRPSEPNALDSVANVYLISG
jgi:hypothetical protein